MRALERALGEIVRRHEALRTVFGEVDGSPVQRVAPFAGFALPAADLAGLGAGTREAEAGRRVSEEAVRPFDLAAGPLFRAALLRLGGEEHALLLSMHHIVSDGWSLGVLFRELSTLYAAYRDGRESPLPELPVQYVDFAAWQRRHLRGEVLERQLAYWKDRLADAPALLELPTDHPRPPVQSFRGAGARMELAAGALERLRALGRQEGATLFMVVLGAFQLLLSRYAGSEDVVVGSPIAGRTRREVEELIGFFVNTLVLRGDLSGDPSFREVVGRVRETTLGAYEHQDLPFEKLVAELHPERSLSRSPFFQVTFTLQDDEGARAGLPGLETHRVEAELASTKYDLVLGVGVHPRGLHGVLTYSTELYEAGTVERMLRHLARVLEQVAEDAEVRLSGIELLEADERRLIVEAWNGPDAELPEERCIHHLFEEQAERTPDAVAVVFQGEALTYAELDARANRLAHALRRRGVGPEVRVGICLERGLAVVVSILGVLKAGGAYVPLDPAHPAERLAFLLEDAAVPVLLTEARLEARLPPHAAGVLRLDAGGAALAAEPGHAPRSGATPRNQAYVLYTSGSTGRPKGVVVEHRGVLNLLRDFQARAPLRPGDRCSVWTSPGFDVSVYEIFSPLLAGASLYVPTEELRLQGRAYLEWLAEKRIRGAYLPPFLLPEYRRWLEDHAGRACMGRLLVGVEPISESLLADIQQRVPGLRVINGYGPTEATICATLYDVPVGVRQERTAPIGRPVANTRGYVLDGSGRLCPVGVPGELYLGGVQLARGYLGRAERTAERFVPDAYSGEAGARLYRTGDRVRWLGEGVLEFLGRIDQQVKVRGFRIEPGEIESALLEDPAVEQAVVMACEDASGKRLVAYVVGEAGLEIAEVRERLRAKLPEYMVPGAFVVLRALPLTPNGKVDRRALPAPEWGTAEDGGYVAPRTPLEEILCGTWAEVLGRERVGIRDNFFDLGGHSLLATRLASRVREVFRVELPIRTFFEAPTVAGSGARLEALLQSDTSLAAPPIVPTPRDGPSPPLSFAQQRLWFLDRLEPGSTTYNLPLALRLRGRLHVRVLERALGEVVRRHEALRTVFPEVGGEPVQRVRPAVAAPLPVVDLSAASEDAREATARRLLREEARRPFDLERGPLLRTRLVRLGTEEHVLFLSMHHIVADGWSVGVLFREIEALHGAFARGEPSPLPEPGVQYADYAVWQRQWLSGETLERQLAWWRERLAGAPAALEIPTDHPRRAAPGNRGAHVARTLPREVAERLRGLARAEGATLHMVLLAALDLLLARWSGAEDVVVGSPIANRNRRETEELIGFFVNTLALRTDLAGNPTFRELLRRVREATLDAYQHQDLPFEKLVEELGTERSLSHTPLFQVMFQVEDAAGAPRLVDGTRAEHLPAEAPPVKFDLTVSARETAEGLGIGFFYREELWDASTLERVGDAYALLLQAAAADPGRRVLDLPLATGAERDRVLRECSTGPFAPFPYRPVHERVAERAARTPGAVVVTCGAEALTCRELDAAANRLARFLRARGVGPDTRVGVCLERSPELPLALLGVLRAGAAYVPLDPGYPAERLVSMLEDSGAPVVLTREALASRFGGWAGGLLRLDSEAARIAAESPEAPSVDVHPESLAYVVYTSGSTGRPKAVGVPHRALANHMRWMQRAFPLTPDDRVLQKTPAGFDASVWEFWAPLVEGAALVMAPPEAHRDPDELLRVVRQERITVLQLVPSMLRALLERPGLEECTLRRLFCGGEALPTVLAARARAMTGAEVVNLYGPTEVCIDSVAHVFAGERGATVPIGQPVDNVRAYVVDAAGAPLPVGFPGELQLMGAQTARGYLGRPELTAERFVPDELSGVPGARLYRTGDRVLRLPDGVLEFLGRIDRQVKIRGFRIEPGEIESVLVDDPAVEQAVVMVWGEESGKRLAAYVVGTAELDVAQVRERLRAKLPEYMVPSAFVVLDRLPLNANGKLDRRALPAPEHTAARETYVAPRTAAEEVVAGIWAETLRLERVGVAESFFELGGHSLLATRVASRIREVFGVELPLRALFESPTVAALAARVVAPRRAGIPVLPPVAPTARTGTLPLSFAQERLWFIDRMQPGSATYNLPVALRLRGPLHARTLERALGEIVRRHEALRTVFGEVDGSPVQRVAPFAGFALPAADLSGLGAGAREAEAGRRISEEAVRPFDLAAGPLFRAALLRLGGEEHALLLCMHHVVSDGWSLGVLFRELSTLYAAYRERRESPLPELAVQYVDYAAWQRRHLRGEALERQLAYWKDRLADAPALLELPTDHPRPPVQSFRGAGARMELASGALERLRALGRQEGATLFMVVLGAFQLLLSRYAGSEDVVVGSPIAGRTRREVEELIGFFVNTLVLRSDLSGDPSFREVVGQVREATLGAYEHQDLPFEKLVAELHPERSLSRSPFFQVTFTLQDGDDAGAGLPGLETHRVEAELASTKYDLVLGVGVHPRGLHGVLTYSTELYEAGTVERMLRHLGRVLEQVAEDAEVRLSGIELLEADERRLIVEDWNGPGAEPPAERCIHQLFEEQAERTPDAVAVVFQGEALTYAELDARANRLAHALRRRGVGPEVRVGICLERGLAVVVSILGVLKAGGAYVPLDPAHPAERLAFLLEDAAVQVLLTEARLEARLPPHAAGVLRLDAGGASPAAEPGHAPRSGATPRNQAYVLYTSGSTGRPKGVVVEHRGVLNLLRDFQARAPLQPGDRCSVWTSPGFDVSVYEIFSPLLAGASLHVPTEELRLQGRAYLEWLAEKRIRGAYLPPFLLPEYRRWLEDHAGRACMGRLLVGVEPISESLLVDIQQRVPGLRVINGYGPTEATICATLYDVPVGVRQERTAPIGRPVANTRGYVLDGSGRLCPVGVPGELYLGGVQLARGYLGRAERTAERFVPDAYSGEAGARLYRTGDRVRWLGEGVLEFLGRIDQQVKVRGFRIEPGEIESALLEDPAIREAVVVAREGASGLPDDRRLVGYVSAAGDGVPSAMELREQLGRRLPEYMVPSAIIVVDALPRTPSGKVDRRSLPEPGPAAPEGHAAPGTPTEEVVSAIFEEVLGAARVGAHDNFFERGGHSLLATRVVSRVAASLGVELPLRALFEAQTVAELAARIDAARREGEGVVLPPLVAVDRSGPLPLSFAQERLWFLHQMDPRGAGYNMPFPSRVAGPLDVGALRRALGALVRRHESLRTVFRPVDGGAVQVVSVAPAAPARVPLADLSGLAPEAREVEARRLAGEDGERPFDLRYGPLLRLSLLRLRDDEHVMLLCMHHIVSDGWSMGVLFRELYALYTASSRGEAPRLPPLGVQYGDFAVWQRGWLAGDALRRQLDWWRERLAGSPPALELPTDRPRPAVASGRGASVLLRVPADDVRALRTVGRREGATLYMVLRAAADVLLARWSGQEDLVVGSPIAGRTRVELEGQIGFFVNTLALRTDLAGDPAFHELVARVRETALGAYAHQDLPFERLVEEVAPERSLSRTPVFQVMFALQNAQDHEVPAPPGLHVERFRTGTRTARFDLELDLFEQGEELVGGVRFRTDLFDPATMERFAAHFRTLLASAGASPQDRCSRLRLLPEEEARLLRAYGSGPAPAAHAGESVPRLLAARAARTPDAVAVRSGAEALTHAQLHRRAAGLARRLRARGVGAGATVAVCLERGPQLLVALLAVWTVGGVYLPLDPTHPAERLSFLLRDSGAELVLTESLLAGSLPEHGAGVVLLDSAPGGDVGEAAAEPHGAPEAHGPAYLVYTSGSTGTPKAVGVEHAQLAHTLRGSLGVLGFAPDDVVAALASVAFDISLLELLAPLLAGAAVRIVPRDVARDPAELVQACADVTVLHAVPALMRQVVEAARGGRALPGIRLLLVGGDTVAPDLLRDVREVFPGAATRVLYGPTEATIICATYAVPPRGEIAGHPLGHPLPGVGLRVRGPRGEVLPLGVPGELWISGGGVARGYLDRPELTAEKFVTVDEERAYRTGDRARWRPDGVLEFLGRTDEQVKVRGFRIEPGEVEAALRVAPDVREAVVLAREDASGEKRLVAYVVPESTDRSAGEALAAEQVTGWEAVFDETYGEGGAEPTLNLTGWNSSYTGEPIPREEMREWVETTVERILALRPQRVLEIGCGTGLLLFRLAPHLRSYHGTDFSGVALEHVRRHLTGLPQVTLAEREAADLAAYAGAGLDTVVLNSVAQYFPDLDYLLRVLEGAAEALAPGGRIFVGDVRSLPLLAAFHASVELARAPEELPAGRLRERVRRGVAEEQELVVDPAFFEALRARLPRLGRVEVQVKRGGYDNEVSRFRYDAVLHLDVEPAGASEPAVRSWCGEDAAGVSARFGESAAALLLRGVPDARVREHVRAAELLSGPEAATAGEVRALSAGNAAGVPPEALFALGEALGRAVEVRPGAPGTLDVLLHPAGGVAAFPAEAQDERPWAAYANDPRWGRRIRALAPALRAGLRARLPEYMLPSAFVVLEALPVTTNGKVDRQALPVPDTAGARDRAYAAPRSSLEEALVGIWQEVLGVERVGIHDNFFDLGGHSLLATQLVARIRVLRVEVPVRQVFQTPTVAGLAESVTRNETTPGATERIAGVLLRLKTMSPGERAAALRAKQTTVGA